MEKVIAFVILGMLVSGVTACATIPEECVGYEKGSESYKECRDITQEYRRVEYKETVFIPRAMYGCKDGFPMLIDPSMKMRMAMKRKQYTDLSIWDMRSLKCCSSWAACGVW